MLIAVKNLLWYNESGSPTAIKNQRSFLYNSKCRHWKLKIPQSTIGLLTGRLVKILLNREVSTMKFNTRNKKIEAITEKTLVIGIDVVKHTMQECLTTAILSIQRSHSALVIAKPNLKCSKHGSPISKKSMKRIRSY